MASAGGRVNVLLALTRWAAMDSAVQCRRLLRSITSSSASRSCHTHRRCFLTMHALPSASSLKTASLSPSKSSCARPRTNSALLSRPKRLSVNNWKASSGSLASFRMNWPNWRRMAKLLPTGFHVFAAGFSSPRVATEANDIKRERARDDRRDAMLPARLRAGLSACWCRTSSICSTRSSASAALCPPLPSTSFLNCAKSAPLRASIWYTWHSSAYSVAHSSSEPSKPTDPAYVRSCSGPSRPRCASSRAWNSASTSSSRGRVARSSRVLARTLYHGCTACGRRPAAPLWERWAARSTATRRSPSSSAYAPSW
mmetsp:Transcript_65927/g.201880  ORF Transcript_65927/g.201880 Transcript_65927/m.201880 type:complete len:313 (-) Transcript_65927:324-1262(-)